MKFQILLICLLGFSLCQNQAGDWSDHSTGHELFVTLSNERDLIFTILFFKDMANSPRQIKINDRARTEVESLVNGGHPGVVYTEVDMSNSNRNAYTYERLATKQLGINLNELEYGPVAVVIQNGVGQLVVYKGNYEDFIQTTDRTIHQVNADAEAEYDTQQALQAATAAAATKKLNKGTQNVPYFRPRAYDPHEFQTEDRYGYEYDPSYYESPVAVASSSRRRR